MKWLLQRAQQSEPKVSQNKQYAAEVLAIFLQTSEKIRASVLELDVVDILLQLLAAYRKKDPEKDSEEEEYVENIFDCLTCLVETDAGKQKFIQAEGVELGLIMLREGKFSKQRALRTLDHAMSGLSGAAVCEQVVEAAGLKTIFGMFKKDLDHTATEHILGMFASMLRSLPGGSAQRIRLLAKFEEKEYEKVKKLVKLRQDFALRLGAVDEKIAAEQAELSEEDKEDSADAFLSRRLDAGLYNLQTVDVILAWLLAEDDGARDTIVQQLAAQGRSLADITATLKAQLSDVTSASDDGSQDMKDAKDMLTTLLECL